MLPTRFENRHVVVTGGTGALGTAVVGILLNEGAICHIPCLHESELKRFPLACHERVRISTGVDLTDEPAVEKFFKDVAASTSFPGLWASIHIAGGFAMSPIEKTSKSDFVLQMQSNALSCFLCCREAVKLMKSRWRPELGPMPGGRIVNVAARPALEPRMGGGMVAYTAAKSAVAAITQALSEEVAASEILVNAVVPSIMDTPANRAAMPTADFAKWPKVAHVAATIAFLASTDNQVTRGGLVPVYGQS